MKWLPLLKRLAQLEFLTGYRTYAGAVGKALAGVGSLGLGVKLFLDPAASTEATVAAFTGGVYLISDAVSTLGLGKKVDDNTAVTVEVADALSVQTGEFQSPVPN